MTIPPTGRVLGVDWGSSRIGLAISDETQLVSTPLDILRYRTGKRLPLASFLDIVEREHPVGIVVGVPHDDDGREGASARSAREMGRFFAQRARLPVTWIDEDFTTADAAGRAREAGVAKTMIDARAAAVILQRWLERRRNTP